VLVVYPFNRADDQPPTPVVDPRSGGVAARGGIRMVAGTRLKLDAATGVLRGIAPQAGDAEVALEAFDGAGEGARQEFTLHALACQ